MMVNLFRPVHVKTLSRQKRPALPTTCKLLQENPISIANDIRCPLRNWPADLRQSYIACGAKRPSSAGPGKFRGVTAPRTKSVHVRENRKVPSQGGELSLAGR